MHTRLEGGTAGTRRPRGHWTQVDREGHRGWAALIVQAPRAAEVMLHLTAHVGDHDAVVVAHGTLARITGRSLRTIQRALRVLVERDWLRPVRIGSRSSAPAYLLDAGLAWRGCDGPRLTRLSAAILVEWDDQPAAARAAFGRPIRRLPPLAAGWPRDGTGRDRAA